MSDYESLDEVRSFLDGVGAALGQGQVFPKPNDDEAEWRGVCYEVPCRVMVDAVREVEVSARAASSHGRLVLMFDAEKTYDAQSPADPWSDDEMIDVFVGRGTYIFTKAVRAEQEIAAYGRLPPDLAQAIIHTMQRDDIRYFRIQDTGIDAAFRELLPSLPDAPRRVGTLAQFVGWAAAYLARTPGAAGPAGAPGGGPAGSVPVAQRMTCQYCRTLFLPGPSAQCPNCGAPAKA